MRGGGRTEGGGERGLKLFSLTPSLSRVLLTLCAKQVHSFSVLPFSGLLTSRHAYFAFQQHCSLPHSQPLCSGWRGGDTDLHSPSTSSMCKQVKKERKHSEDDEILSKLQRDDVSASC